jgi:Flp pilus assembly pilin Flp
VTYSKSAALPDFRAEPGFEAYCRRLVDDERGQDMIEYALIAATIGLGSVAGIHGVAASVAGYMQTVGQGFDAALAAHS